MKTITAKTDNPADVRSLTEVEPEQAGGGAVIPVLYTAAFLLWSGVVGASWDLPLNKSVGDAANALGAEHLL